MYKFRQILFMDLKNLFTNRMWIFYAIGFPLALVLILGFLASGGYGTSVTSYDYFGIAVMIFAVFNTSTFSANSFLEERIKSPNMRIVYSPVRPFAIHFSKTLASFIFCSITCTLVTGFLWMVAGVNYGGNLCWAPFVLMLLSIFFFSALGVLVCCVLKSEDMTNQILSLVLTLLAVLGGVFFPIDGLGSLIASLSWISPAKWILACCLRIVYDGDFSLFTPACLVLVLLSALTVWLSTVFFRQEDYL